MRTCLHWSCQQGSMCQFSYLPDAYNFSTSCKWMLCILPSMLTPLCATFGANARTRRYFQQSAKPGNEGRCISKIYVLQHRRRTALIMRSPDLTLAVYIAPEGAWASPECRVQDARNCHIMTLSALYKPVVW